MPSRVESDSLGPVEIPEGVLWGPQTARATAYFAVGEELMPPAVIRALGLVKQAAAQVNQELGLLSAPLAPTIAKAAGEVGPPRGRQPARGVRPGRLPDR